ncbi:MAG: universal stress protein [Proteobacteria bacterium]|nr:universal stress protein [Pseudomonadota bacterium]
MEQKKILLAIDGSKHSNAVLEKSIEYAKFLNAKIIILYCHNKFPVNLGEPYRDSQIAAIIRESEKLVAPFVQRLESENIPVEDRLMEEPAGKMISEVAEIEKCDLVIIGSRGFSNLTNLIVGSVTTRVLQTAPCPVLVIR